MKNVNFNAGPSILSQFTIENTANAVKDLDGIGLSLMEISHRSKEFTAIMQEAQSLLKEILEIPEGYSVLYLGGGANLQFCMVPFNLLNTKAAYLNSGSWATKAIKEAQFFGDVVEVASSKDKNFSYIPKNYDVPDDGDYFHITTNNTIYGTEIKNDMDCEVPLVADMSSDILSRPVDVSKYAIIYGGAQKNLGPAGVAFVIIKDDILGKVNREIPNMLNYKVHIEKGSLYNTPPVVPVYSSLQTLKWIKQMGGLSVLHKLNQEKARMLYDELDRNKLFVGTVADEEDRSIMNVTFVMADEYKDLEKDFLEFATNKGMIGIKGHRSVGGFRASIYNAMTKEGVQALINVMKQFEASR